MRGGSGTGVEGTTEAVVSLFGRTATLVVPTGRDNVADLLEIFVKLDTSLSELKQENKVVLSSLIVNTISFSISCCQTQPKYQQIVRRQYLERC